MAKKCRNGWCEQKASEASGMCFMCAEEWAVTFYDLTLEMGGTREQAKSNAQKAWTG